MLQFSPETFQQLLVSAERMLRAGQFTQAEAVCRQVLAMQPGHGRAWQVLGLALVNTRRPAEAAEALAKSAALLPGDASIWRELGRALISCSHMKEAAQALEKAVALDPRQIDWGNELGLACELSGQLEKSAAALERCLTLNPHYPPVLNNLGNVYKALGRLSEAADCFERGLAAAPDDARLRCNHAVVAVLMGHSQRAAGDYRIALNALPNEPLVRSGYLMCLQYLPAQSRAEIFREHQQFQTHCATTPAIVHVSPDLAAAGKRLRIGYVSSDFRTHSVAFFLEPLLAHHDKTQVEIFCYADPLVEDAATLRFRQYADTWRNTLGLSAAAVAQQIRADGIDILVDLQGHTAGSRLATFAMKPAPVQVTYLGYPDTTGLSAIDYRLTDAYADPEGDADRFHSEKLLRLPDSFLCYQPPADAPSPECTPSGRGGITFASFNALSKLTSGSDAHPLIPLWCKLLNRVPDSHLLLKTFGLQDPALRASLFALFHAQGITPDRLTLLPQTHSLADHLACYQQADIALDSFPYNGTTTTCEALYMGLPVVTLAGDRHASRVGVSLLNNAGLADLIAQTPDQYLDLATDLANNPARRQQLRQTLRPTLHNSPLLNAPQFAHNVESTYRNIWHTWCHSHMPVPGR